MPRPEPIGYDELKRKLANAGYIPVRKSKHTIYFNPRKEITIPIPHKHPGDLSKGLLNKLIKEMGVSREEFYNL